MVDINPLSRQPIDAEVVWIGALSFEERCYGSLQVVVDSTNRPRAVHLLDYSAKVQPRGDGAQFRALHKTKILKLAGESLAGVHRLSHARYLEGLRLLAMIGRDYPPELPFLVDLTCMTKLHAACVAYMLCTEWADREVFVAFSHPRSYGHSMWRHGKWRDILQVRLDLDSEHRHRGSEAIAIPGHEGDRMRLAIHEVQPQVLSLIRLRTTTGEHHAAETVTDIQNADLIERIEDGNLPGYQIKEVGDFSELFEEVEDRVRSCRTGNHRLVLLPFGPKWLVFATFLQALHLFREAVWISYPVVDEYDATYSNGYAFTEFANAKAFLERVTVA